MSKVIKGAVIGAAIGVGLFFLAPAVGLGALSVGGTALTIKSAAIIGAVYGGLQGAALQFAKKPNMDLSSSLGRLNISVDPQTPAAWVFGETACATDAVFAEQIGDNVIAYVIAAAAHEIDSFGTLHINDDLITFSGDASTGDWAGALTRITRTGTSTQTAITIPGSTQWTSAAQGRGIAHFCLIFDLGGDTNNKLASGIPTRITQVIKGAKVYDPRLDSTRGGSGSHRTDDQSTWAWSDNWALIVAHYLLGYKQSSKLVYGVGINPDDIDWLQVIAMANVCDATVDGVPRYRVGGILPTTQDHAGIIGQLEAAIDGKVSKVGGKYYIWAPHNDLTPAGTINDALILRDAGVSFIPAGPISGLYNTARGRYIDPASLYQPVPYPEVIESTAVTEDERERVMERDFSIIQDRSVAERVAREMVRRSRFSGSWTLAMGPGGLAYQPFSVVTLNLPETDNQNVLARVIDLQFSADGVVALTLREEDASIYDTTVALGAPITQNNPDSFDPTRAFPVTGLAAVAISAIGGGGSRSDGFRVSWSSPGRFVRTTEIRYKIVTDTDYAYFDAPEITQAVIVPVEPDTLYDIEAAHISISGVIGPYEAIQQTSSATSRAISITGRVEYSQSNAWVGDGVTFDPPNLTSDATFTFRRLDTVIATRVIRGTLSTTTGKVTISELSVSGEATTLSLLNDASEAVTVSVTHTDSGSQISGQFLVLSDTDLSLVQQELDNLQDEIDNLNNITLPQLQDTLDNILPITETKITDSAITAPKIAANAIIAGKIGADAVTANTIAAGAVTAAKISVDNLAAINTLSGTLTAQLIRTNSTGGRIEITDPETDAAFAIWQGSATGKTLANARFALQHDGDAVFRGRITAPQLEGAIFDAVPFDFIAPSVSTNSSTTTWVTVGDRFLEFPETIDRPRRAFFSLIVPVFVAAGQTSTGAEIRAQVKIQNDDGSFPTTWTTLVQDFTVDTTTHGSPAPIAGGTVSTGIKGFRMRVQFRSLTAGQVPATNRYSGIFFGFPTITGFNVLVDSTGGSATGGTAPSSSDLLEPPNFNDGWPIP